VAKACRAYYETTRDEVLRDFPWPFATRVVPLAVVADYSAETSTTYPEYAYAYRYPAECLRFIRIRSGGGRFETNASRIRTRIIGDADGLLILADIAPAWAEYVVVVEDVSRWPADAISAFSLLLASKIAPRVTGGDPNKLGLRSLQPYDLARKKALANALNEQTGDDGMLDSSGFMSARA
jgi:hypothetical protein